MTFAPDSPTPTRNAMSRTRYPPLTVSTCMLLAVITIGGHLQAVASEHAHTKSFRGRKNAAGPLEVVGFIPARPQCIALIIVVCVMVLMSALARLCGRAGDCTSGACKGSERKQ